jgi:hypothetical protein
MLEIALPNISWPLLPPDRFNSRQALLQMQLACDRLAQVGSSSSSSSCSKQSSPYKIRTHKHIKNNPFDVLLQPPEETEVIGRWQMRAGTRGSLRQLYLLDPYDPFPRPSSLMEVRGGLWELAHVRLQ